MGRVARYKKVKKSLVTSGGADYFDTVGVWGLGESGRKVKKRSRTVLKLRIQREKPTTAQEFDVAPECDDFDLQDLVGSLKREAIHPDAFNAESTSTTIASHGLSTTPQILASKTPAAESSAAAIDGEEEKLIKKFEKQVEPQKPVVAAEERMRGESKRAYNRRVKLETRQIIQRASRQEHNPEKRQKKKDFLNSKKKKGKRTIADIDNNDNNNNNDEVPEGKLLTGEQAVAARARKTQVYFGEQAERPPVFKQLPRGAAKKNEAKRQKSTTSLMNQAEMDAEQQAMELMRRKVQAQYAVIKTRRKLEGDFHL